MNYSYRLLPFTFFQLTHNLFSSLFAIHDATQDHGLSDVMDDQTHTVADRRDSVHRKDSEIVLNRQSSLASAVGSELAQSNSSEIPATPAGDRFIQNALFACSSGNVC